MEGKKKPQVGSQLSEGDFRLNGFHRNAVTCNEYLCLANSPNDGEIRVSTLDTQNFSVIKDAILQAGKEEIVDCEAGPSEEIAVLLKNNDLRCYDMRGKMTPKITFQFNPSQNYPDFQHKLQTVRFCKCDPGILLAFGTETILVLLRSQTGLTPNHARIIPLEGISDAHFLPYASNYVVCLCSSELQILNWHSLEGTAPEIACRYPLSDLREIPKIFVCGDHRRDSKNQLLERQHILLITSTSTQMLEVQIEDSVALTKVSEIRHPAGISNPAGILCEFNQFPTTIPEGIPKLSEVVQLLTMLNPEKGEYIIMEYKYAKDDTGKPMLMLETLRQGQIELKSKIKSIRTTLERRYSNFDQFCFYYSDDSGILICRIKRAGDNKLNYFNKEG